MNNANGSILRTYRAEPLALFGACLTVLGQMQASIAQHDAERGLIVAHAGRGWLAPRSELTLEIDSAGAGVARLAGRFRPLQRGGDVRLLPTLVQALDALLPRA